MFCNCRYNCNGLAIVASLFIGIISAILSFTGIITVAPVFFWVILGVAVAYLAIVLASSATRKYNDCKACVCSTLGLLLTGILGSILTSLVLLAITFVATSALGAIILGVALFFFSLIFTSTACLVKCLSDCNSNDCEGQYYKVISNSEEVIGVRVPIRQQYVSLRRI